MTSALPSPMQAPAMRGTFDALARQTAERSKIEAAGEAALRRLYAMACRDSGQCRYIAHFLLGLYNGQRFPFDLTNLRGLDGALFEDCMAVLRMDARVTAREVHRYFDDGGRKFEQLAASLWVSIGKAPHEPARGTSDWYYKYDDERNAQLVKCKANPVELARTQECLLAVEANQRRAKEIAALKDAPIFESRGAQP